MTIKTLLLSVALLSAATASAQTPAEGVKTHRVDAWHISAGSNMTAPADSGGIVRFVIDERREPVFTQSCVKQTAVGADFKVDNRPYYNVRYALPIPAAYTPTEQGALVGIDEGVYTHMHSAGMDIMPNGDVLAVYFSTPAGKAEADTSTTFVQARLRCGADEWDMPELLFNTHGGNDQSALLYRDGSRMWFFGGGRSISDWVPFRVCSTDDNGATWTYSVPKLSAPATLYTAQPVSNAFRDPDGNLYFVSDGKSASSFLWRSSDNGVSWYQMPGRTSTRHSTIVPLDSHGTLLSLGGKNNNMDRWNVQNTSTDWGRTWSEGRPSPIPQLGTAQRPCMIRLQSGRLLVVTDSYYHKYKVDPPADWKYGNDCVVGISDDNGQTWRMKNLPVTLPQHHRVAHPSLGYVTVRQADNGMIHILTTTNYPGLDIEFNEAWVLSDVKETPHYDAPKGARQKYSECYANGNVKSKWTARTSENGRYLLDGKQTDYFENGKVQHEVTYVMGRKSGKETFYREDGTMLWQWNRNLKTNRGVWTQYHPNGKKRVESEWNLRPSPRDLPDHVFNGSVAEGTARHWSADGALTATYHFTNGVLDGSDGTKGGILNEGK